MSGAASVIVACWRRRFLVRLVDTSGYDSGAAAGTAHVEALLERLATVEPVEAGRLTATMAACAGRQRRAWPCCSASRPGRRGRLARLRPPFGALAVVAFPPAPGAVRPPPPPSPWSRTTPASWSGGGLRHTEAAPPESSG